ncbi:MAG: sugar ABC transporter permease, partial [Clostridia bacterium]|nr:sugar ABC transporter permease [Clostridia bacterium]
MKLRRRDETEPRRKLTGKEVATRIWNDRVGYFMCMPYFLLFVCFTVVPVIISMYYSFTDFNMIQTPNFVGVDNYTRLFLRDDSFLIAIRNTVILAGVTGP